MVLFVVRQNGDKYDPSALSTFLTYCHYQILCVKIHFKFGKYAYFVKVKIKRAFLREAIAEKM